MDILIILGIVFLAVIVLLLLWAITTHNSFIRIKNSIEEAFSTIDVYLKKRYNLIPNLVETVKGYAKHEASTLENVMKARNAAMGAQNIQDKVEGENMLAGTLKSLFAIAEAYPDLKANANFLSLQNDLNKTETEIANSRKYYNAVVKEFNTKREIFPSLIIANIFNYEKMPLFEVTEEAERKNIKVQF